LDLASLQEPAWLPNDPRFLLMQDLGSLFRFLTMFFFLVHVSQPRSTNILITIIVITAKQHSILSSRCRADPWRPGT
jgi:hypothetical protein